MRFKRPGGMNSNDIIVGDEYLKLGMLGRFDVLRMIAPIFRVIGLVYLAA